MSVLGGVIGRVCGSVFGSVGPGAGTATVKAWRQGWYGGRIRQPGESFQITSPFDFTAYWMTITSTYPASWTVYLNQSFSEQTDQDILTPITASDIAQKTSQVDGPYGVIPTPYGLEL